MKTCQICNEELGHDGACYFGGFTRKHLQWEIEACRARSEFLHLRAVRMSMHLESAHEKMKAEQEDNQPPQGDLFSHEGS